MSSDFEHLSLERDLISVCNQSWSIICVTLLSPRFPIGFVHATYYQKAGNWDFTQNALIKVVIRNSLLVTSFIKSNITKPWLFYCDLTAQSNSETRCVYTQFLRRLTHCLVTYQLPFKTSSILKISSIHLVYGLSEKQLKIPEITRNINKAKYICTII